MFQHLEPRRRCDVSLLGGGTVAGRREGEEGIERGEMKEGVERGRGLRLGGKEYRVRDRA